jgi:hypothetical protein
MLLFLSAAEAIHAGASLIHLQGAASLLGKDNKQIRQLVAADMIRPGDRFRTESRSRIALRLPDGSHLRFDELTTAELTTLAVDEGIGKRTITVHLFTGNAWIHVPKAFKENRGIVLETPTAVGEAGMGTYRITIPEDKSVLLKVYRGSIYLHSPEAAHPSDSQTDTQKTFRPKKRWSHYIKPMYQIRVRPDGTSTQPFRFTTKGDKNEWVRWNQKLDKGTGERPR